MCACISPSVRNVTWTQHVDNFMFGGLRCYILLVNPMSSCVPRRPTDRVSGLRLSMFWRLGGIVKRTFKEGVVKMQPLLTSPLDYPSLAALLATSSS